METEPDLKRRPFEWRRLPRELCHSAPLGRDPFERRYACVPQRRLASGPGVGPLPFAWPLIAALNLVAFAVQQDPLECAVIFYQLSFF